MKARMFYRRRAFRRRARARAREKTRMINFASDENPIVPPKIAN